MIGQPTPRLKWSVMPVAIDASVLISAEKEDGFQALRPKNKRVLVGTRPTVREDVRHRARRIPKHHVDGQFLLVESVQYRVES